MQTSLEEKLNLPSFCNERLGTSACLLIRGQDWYFGRPSASWLPSELWRPPSLQCPSRYCNTRPNCFSCLPPWLIHFIIFSSGCASRSGNWCVWCTKMIKKETRDSKHDRNGIKKWSDKELKENFACPKGRPNTPNTAGPTSPKAMSTLGYKAENNFISTGVCPEMQRSSWV